MRTLALFLVAMTLHAGEATNYKASLVVYSGCAAADVATSWGREELHPALRSADGRFGGRGLAIKGIIAGASLGIQWLTRRHKPGKLWTAANYVVGAAWCGAAVWNQSTR